MPVAIPRLAASTILAVLVLTGAAHAQPYTWDPTQNPPAPVGGTGTWDTTTANWSNGVADFVWPGGANLAIFGGTAGTVTIAPGGITAGGLTFTATGYALTGDTLTLSGPGVISVAAPLAGTTSAQTVLTDTIGSAIGGSVGLTKAGIGTLVLTGANSYTGPTTVAGGTLTLDFNAGAATTILNPANGLVFGGANGPAGTFSVNGATAGSSQSVSGVTLTSGSATISATSNTGTVALSLGGISRSPGTALRFIVPAAGSITTTTANANPTGGQQTILGGYAAVSGATVSTWAVSGSGSTAGAISGLATYNPANTFTAGADIDVNAVTTSAATITINSLRLSSTTGGATLLTLSNPLTVATGGVLLANAASANSAITGSTITSGSSELVFNNYSRIDGTSRELLVASKVTGSINVTINGAGANGTGGQVELQNSNNDFVGTITVIGGRLGNGANTVTGGNAAFLGLGNATNPVVVVGNAAGGGEWFMNGAQNQSRPITISGVGWAESGGSFGAFRPRNTISGQITLAGNARIGVNNTGVVLSGKITGPYELSLDGNTTNPITISGTVNNYSGGTRIERGTAIMGATNALPTNTLLTFGTTYGAADTLRPEGLGTTTNAPTLNINGFATQVGGLAIEAGDAPAVANATITNTGAAAAFTVNNVANSTFGGVITNTTNGLSLAKSGIGTLTLSGANTYTGTTTVNGGTLALVSSSSTNNVGSSTAIAVGPGATLDVTGITGGFTLGNSQTLTNNGTVAGSVTAQTGTTGTVTGTGAFTGNVTIAAGTFTPGTLTTIGTIQSIGGNLAVNGGTFKIKVGGATSDQIANLIGSANFASNRVLSVAQLGAPASASYTILTAPGGITGLTAAPLVTIGRTTYSIDGPALASNTLKLDVTGGPANMRWVGGDAVHNPTRWENTQQDANWTTADAVADTTHFYDGDFVTFNNANNGNFTVNVTGTVSPGSITVSNGGGTTSTFADGGTGQIAGNTGLTMSSSDGTGTLVIATHNTFAGVVSINSGVVSISSSDNLGNASATNTIALAGGTLRATATLDLGANRAIALGTGGGTLDVAGAATTLTVSGVVSGAGTGDALTKVGLGTLVLSAANTYNGPTTISAGALKVTNSASLGALPGGTVTIAAGGVLDLGGGAAANTLNFGQKQFFVAGDGDGTNGAITNSAAVNQQNGLQRVRLSADASFGGANRFDIRAGQVGGVNTAQLDLQGHTLTKNGSFFFPLVATDVTDGNIVVNGGTLSIETTTNVPAGAGTSITFNTGTTWSMFGLTGTLARPIIINGAVTVGANNTAVSTAASPITLNGDLTATALNTNGAGTVALTGPIGETGGPHSITKINNGTGNSVLALSGNNTFSGGTNVNAGIVEISTAGNLGTGPLTFGGGTLRFATGSGGADVSGHTVTLNAPGGTIDTNGNSAAFANAIGNGGAGGLTKAGAGTLTLNGANNYSGATTVSGGTLLVGGVAGSPGSLPAASTVTVNAGTLGGFGTINGPTTVTATGTVAPGASAGTLSFGNNLTINGTYAWELATAGTPDPTFTGQSSPTLPHTNHDVLVAAGVVDLTGSSLTLTSLPGSTFNNTQPYSWKIATGSTITSVPTITAIGGADFGGLTPASFSLANPGTRVLLLNYTPVPEPAFMLLACGAVAGGFGWCRRAGRRGNVTD